MNSFSLVGLSVLLWIVMPADLPSSARADEKPPSESSATDELDRQLLEEQLEELQLDEADVPPIEAQPQEKANQPADAEGVPDGPPVRSSHPLLRVGDRMRDVEGRIAQTDTGRKTQQIQEHIVRDLDKLIDQLKQQASSCSSCSGAGCAQCQQLVQQKMQRPQQPNNSGRPSGNPNARAAANQAGKTAPKAPSLAARMNLLKDVWGHLPDRVRIQMEQQFLQQVPMPKYQTLIEEYFRTLAEQGARDSNP